MRTLRRLSVCLLLASAPSLAFAQATCVLDSGTATATGQHSTACGNQATASGEHATAVGMGAKALDARNVAVGAVANADGLYSTAIGTATEANGVRSSAIGVHAEASGEESTAVGAGTEVSGRYATALGSDAQAHGADGTALGHGAVSVADESVALGAYSVSDRAKAVSVGNAEAGLTRQITNVARATQANDAVNLGQMNERFAAVDAQFRSIEQRMTSMDKRIDGIGAMSAAMAHMTASAAGINANNRIAGGVGRTARPPTRSASSVPSWMGARRSRWVARSRATTPASALVSASGSDVRIALVEDHARMAELIRTALTRAGLASDVYGTCAAANYWLRRQAYGALVLDRGLPDGDGLSIIAGLRREGSSMPCLVLTARDALHDRVAGLEHGADDYLPKPFAIEELVARVRALLRRPATIAPRCYVIANLEVDADACRVRVDALPLAMGATEFRLLLALAEAGGAMRSPSQLMDAVFGPFAPATRNTLEVAVHRLRARLRACDAHVELINERGVGYALLARR